MSRRSSQRGQLASCEQCGSEFTRTINSVGRFCSYRCYGDSKRVVVCASCRVSYSTCACGTLLVNGRGRRRVRCDDCNRRVTREKAYARDSMRRTRGPFGCVECGITFIPEYANKRRRFCSEDCSERASNRSSKNSVTGLRRRRSAKRIRTLRPTLLTKYDGRCGICGRPIDLSLHYLHPLALTIDHIYPISAGGSDAIENLWPAHRQCNVDKGDDIGWRADSALFAVA